MPAMPSVHAVILPILRAAPALQGVTFTTWIPNINHREFPLINLRSMGGIRSGAHPTLLSNPVVEMTAFTQAPAGDIPSTEALYDDALEALFEAFHKQTQTDAGYLCSVRETMGKTQFSSLFQDSWRIQGLIHLGVRPPRSP